MNRLIQLFVLLIICLYSCTNNKPVTLQTKTTNLYFNYDEVEHFHLDVTHQALQSITKEVRYKDLLKFLTEPIKSISDSSFFSLLYTYPFQKKLIPNTKFDELDSIFQVKKHQTFESFACIPTYRDLLIFKRAGQVIGIAKICFECNQHSIIGTKMNTDNFGQSGDYEKLAQLLNN